MVALRLSAAVAPYLYAIQDRRAAGWRWSDIRAALGLDCSDAAIGQAVRRCKWKAEQLPLPEVQGPEKNSKQHLGKAPSAFTEKRPLPGRQIPVGDAEAIVDAVEEKLGTNFFK